MKQQPFFRRFIKFFYGIMGPLDEHKQEEANQIGGLGFIYLWYLIVPSSLFALLASHDYPHLVAYAYPIALIILTIVFAIYVTVQSLHKQVTSLDQEIEEYAAPVSNIRRNSTILCTSILFISQVLTSDWSDAGSLLAQLVNPKRLLMMLVQGIIFWFIFSALYRSKKHR